MPHGPGGSGSAATPLDTTITISSVAEVAPPPADGPDDELSADERYQVRLGERLRAIRRSQGLRLQDVEINSDGRFKAVVVGSYERGDRAVAAHKLASLAAFYGVPVTEVLPDEAAPNGAGREDGIRLAVDRLRAAEGLAETAPLLRLVQHVQWLRGDYNGRVLSLRGDDMRTVAVALDVQPDGLGAWLDERGLLVS
jgi:transcriptional regulator with XRE-family HTH domain